MPTVDVQIAGASLATAAALAVGMGVALELAPGRAWVCLYRLPAEHCAQNSSPLVV